IIMRHYLSASVAAIAVIACSGAAFAQETTSSIRGVVTAGGAPVSGAKVTVTHVPSGTTNTVTTGSDGTFATSGLRIGGPFTVKVTSSGYSDSSVTDIDLTAGQPLRLPIELATSGGEIVVTAAKSKAIELSPGPITSINREKIASMATVNRDIRDIVRRDPFATIDPGQSRGVMIAGQNARLNKFSVDGLGFTDNFGLNVGGLPTSRGPVPIDAIEQLSVKVAPFDISEGNFQGGAINIVLRSGTNKFHGSGFYSYFGDSFRGDQAKGLAKQTTKFSSKNWGGFLSGPIIKDKLFFSLSYERLEESNPPLFGIGGIGNTVPNISQAQIDNLAVTAKSVYGYDTGGLFLGGPETDEKYTAKVDWNIVDGQRFAFTYIHNKGNTANDPGFSNTGPSAPTLSLMSNDYTRP
ncbi:MAG: carboxypeptidase regulatory-like domain-containing protein, partial [Sphingomonas sp.]|nr:carboxypeptidase regulatory-like domain-containing protein [Sphingomonas sp.]